MIRDTIMRQVHQLANAIARALVARKSKDYDQVVDELEEASRQHLGLELDAIAIMSSDDLAELVTVNESVDADLAVSIANMLETRESILTEEDRTGATYLQSALLLLELVRDNPGGLVPLNLDEHIGSIKKRIPQ